MPSGYLVKKRYGRIRRIVLICAVLIGAICAYGAYSIAFSRAHEQAAAAANEALAFQAETLNGLLEKYRLLPPLLARSEDVRPLFSDTDNPNVLTLARERATVVAGLSGARDVLFIDETGLIFASMRGRLDGINASGSTFFQVAMQGRLGRETRFTSDSQRNYVFASAVRSDGRITGVVAVFVLFDEIEAAWSLTGKPIAATDKSGIVFLSNQVNWQSMRLTGEEGVLSETGFSTRGPGSVFRASDGTAYYRAKRNLPLLEWDLHAFEDYRPVLASARDAALLALGSAVFLTLATMLIIDRRENLTRRIRRDQATALRLERQVRDRTADLRDANVTLAHEVEERTTAEKRLRNTQAELVQAAKLAALGQMSATLSHEFNQPLAAISAQADNASRLIERGRPEAAGDAVNRISGLVARMSSLSKTLLSFARKPGTAMTPVSLRLVFDEALVLVAPRLRKSEVTIDHSNLPDDLSVMAGRIRLTQVLINLINNSVDALGTVARNEKRIDIEAKKTGSKVKLVISDNGPGISEEITEKVFDPFVTTKDVGEGLGIGLSVVFNIIKDFGGTIKAVKSASGGARFEIILEAADETSKQEVETVVAAQ